MLHQLFQIRQPPIIHTNLLVPALNGPMPTHTDEERAAATQIATFQQSGNGYFVEMAAAPRRSATPCSTPPWPWPPG